MIDLRLKEVTIETETTVASELDTFYLESDLPPDGGVHAPNVKINLQPMVLHLYPELLRSEEGALKT